MRPMCSSVFAVAHSITTMALQCITRMDETQLAVWQAEDGVSCYGVPFCRLTRGDEIIHREHKDINVARQNAMKEAMRREAEKHG